MVSAYDRGHGLETGIHGVAMSPQEDPTKDSLYHEWFKVYLRENVFKHTGETFEEFLDQPRWKIDLKLSEIKKRNKEEADLAEEIKQGLGNNGTQ